MLGLRSDFVVDPGRLRRERLQKVQSEMAARNIGALVLTNPVNICYCTDVSVMPIWTALNLARYAEVPVGPELLAQDPFETRLLGTGV